MMKKKVKITEKYIQPNIIIKHDNGLITPIALLYWDL
jgi:hypothetical protein